ncbi:hypothetical protein XaC1_189 [Xanthomonas phage XaC1]|nr:hypothetical protein XaC1_189 [Xanthomonas phage XaC1]
MKSKLSIDFGTKTLELDVEWDGTQVTGIDTDICEDLFFSDKYEDLWDSGEHPTMIVESHDGQSSVVRFEEMAGELFSNNPYKVL